MIYERFNHANRTSRHRRTHRPTLQNCGAPHQDWQHDAMAIGAEYLAQWKPESFGTENPISKVPLASAMGVVAPVRKACT